MDIKDFQEKLDGAIEEILKLIEKKIRDKSSVDKQIVLNNINHQINGWQIYVNDYMLNLKYQHINKYDIDIINMILYIMKLYSKLVSFHHQQDKSLFMESYTRFKEDSILYQIIHKINSEYNLCNFISKKYSQHCNEIINNIIEYIQEKVIHLQIKTITNT